MHNAAHNDPSEAPFLLYAGPDGVLRPHVFYAADNVWLNGERIAEIFQVPAEEASEHIQRIYSEGELEPGSTMRTFHFEQSQDGSGTGHTISLYSLDVVIALSYRVVSSRAVQFRKWATRLLRTYMVQGFAVDGERMDQGMYFGKDYTSNLLDRAQDIRASERSLYQKVTSLYTAARNHDKDAEATRDFYRTVQNKLHFAAHGYTAPEVIVRRADAHKPRMGLTSWARSPMGTIRKADIHIAKNYLTADELQRLNRIVTSYLDYAEIQAMHKRANTMEEWQAKLDAFLTFYEYPVLQHGSRITPEAAKSIAEQEYYKYKARSTPTLLARGNGGSQ